MSVTDWKKEWKPLAAMAGVFLLCFYLPVGARRFDNALLEAFHLLKWYAREHVLLCLIPAFFIAGAIAVFISQEAVMKYLGARAKKVVAYSVAAISGSVLAVCSCTVLPLFAGISRMGAGLGPATTFLYAGPAINVLAIILTARVLGVELGIARAVGAIAFSIVIGLLMHFLFLKEENEKVEARMAIPEPEVSRPLRQSALFLAVLVGILVFANWAEPEGSSGLWSGIASAKWSLTLGLGALLSLLLVLWFNLKITYAALAFFPVLLTALLWPSLPQIPFALGVVGLILLTSTSKGEAGDWFQSSWGFAKQILPLLFLGVIFAGALLGRPGHEGLIPSDWVSAAVGGNSLWANLFASVAGAFMYFATLTEVPILQGLIGNGMGKGPALALLLAGPALSLPNMLVIRSVIGTKKTMVFVLLVVLLSTVAGLVYGNIF
ncbi:MAG: permease [Candidatus Aminicenantaceae bacterium]